MTTHVFVVGTDTAVGKSAVGEAILRAAPTIGVSVRPFKPAQSGHDDPSDAQRLCRAAGLPDTAIEALCPLRYDPPLAPGLADDPARFRAPSPPPDREPLRLVQRALQAWTDATTTDIVLVEGAGGLHVPMPGGTWQPEWIVALATHTVVVGRLGLGTINHTLATIEGLRDLGRPPLGFILSETGPADPSAADNPTTIATAAGIPHLGTLPHDRHGHVAAGETILRALMARL